MTWMDTEYAQAYYGVETETIKLRKFPAKGGMRDIYGSVGMTLMFSQNIGANMTMRAAQLLGHAAGSPVSQKDSQPEAQAVLFYQF